MNPDLSSCYALLDDASELVEAAPNRASSRLYTEFVRELVCTEADQLEAICAQAEEALRSGLHAVLLCDYGFGMTLQGVQIQGLSLPNAPAENIASASLRILLFYEMKRLSRDEVDTWLADNDRGAGAEPSPAGICEQTASVTRAQYDAAIATIQDYLRAGDCYQINYTWQLHFAAFGTPLALYRRLRARQPAPYGALIALPDGRAVLSCSPELFLRHQDGRLTARPMKGTASVGVDTTTTKSNADQLLTDPKNRAENLMIVDLLRNDLGRIAVTASVTVPVLFAIERYGDVLQMTSTVEAVPRAGLSFAEILRALFPCGSITGAPKRRAMELIDQIEAQPRQLYTGAFGWLDAPLNGNSLGDFCLSVAIRTLELDAPGNDGFRAGRCGVGGGIVIDSNAEAEYQECALKARFLTGLDPGFELFETLRATRSGCHHLSRHLQRLRTSAACFGFVYDESQVLGLLSETCSQFSSDEAQRLRLSLSHDGQLAVTHAPLLSLNEPVELLLSSETINANDLFLRHKTTLRSAYDRAWKLAEQQGAFDMLFFNAHGELTEGARSNVFVLLDGIWCTPPLACGVLPGVMRAVLLDDPECKTAERVLSRADLLATDGLMVCNALRGALKATLV